MLRPAGRAEVSRCATATREETGPLAPQLLLLLPPPPPPPAAPRALVPWSGPSPHPPSPSLAGRGASELLRVFTPSGPTLPTRRPPPPPSRPPLLSRPVRRRRRRSVAEAAPGCAAAGPRSRRLPVPRAARALVEGGREGRVCPVSINPLARLAHAASVYRTFRCVPPVLRLVGRPAASAGSLPPSAEESWRPGHARRPSPPRPWM